MIEVSTQSGAAASGDTKEKIPRNGSRSSGRMFAAMTLILGGTTPYSASQQCNIGWNAVYRSSLYKMWKAGKLDELRAVMAKRAAQQQGE